jgi:signal transduction histidine kinase/tetratricopeptide (TPR) repeat protein
LAGFIKAQIQSLFSTVGLPLQASAQSAALTGKDYPKIKSLLEERLADSPLVEQVFIAYNGQEPLFPFCQPPPNRTLPVLQSSLKGTQKSILTRAEEREFKTKDYERAIGLYRELFASLKDKNLQAQMLNNIARCYAKSKNYNQAVHHYTEICKDYSDCATASGLSLDLIGRMGILDAYRNSGDAQSCLKNSLSLYGDILENPWSLNEIQYRTYSSLIEEAITAILLKAQNDLSLEGYRKEFEDLKSLHQLKAEEWKLVRDIREAVIPEILKRTASSEAPEFRPFHYAGAVNDKTFLILAVEIPDTAQKNSIGILGVKVSDEYLREVILNEINKNAQPGEKTNIILSSLSGQVLSGKEDPAIRHPTVTEFFEENFPPWRLDFFRGETGSIGTMDIRKSFYFWTILTLIIVLTFGAVLIVRTIAQEMEILKMKSDFVSSVSHEFKTPLTSIQALLERLREGKVKDPAKTAQYLSFLSRDTERLTHLVKNVLDFSKIEEGKKEYEFIETGMPQFLREQIDAFQKDRIQEEVKVHARIPEDIPPLSIDREAVSQALNNLFDNAVKFSPGKKEIDVSVRKSAENVTIEVRDQGIGIPKNEQDKIFNKFYQGQNASTQSVKGTGLGLTLVKHIIEAHGGKIQVESVVGKGSVFSLIFPLKGERK